MTWYKALVAKHLGNTIPGDKKTGEINVTAWPSS